MTHWVIKSQTWLKWLSTAHTLLHVGFPGSIVVKIPYTSAGEIRLRFDSWVAKKSLEWANGNPGYSLGGGVTKYWTLLKELSMHTWTDICADMCTYTCTDTHKILYPFACWQTFRVCKVSLFPSLMSYEALNDRLIISLTGHLNSYIIIAVI